MNDYSNIAEYSVTKKRGKLYNVAKIVAPIVTGVIPILYSVILLFAYGFPPYPIAIIGLSLLLLFFTASCFRRIDYDYRMIGSELSFSIVYNRRKRKELGSIDVSRLEKIVPYDGKYADEIDEEDFDKVLTYCSSPDDPDVYCAVDVDEEKNTRMLYLFNPSERMLQLIKQYNRRAVITLPKE